MNSKKSRLALVSSILIFSLLLTGCKPGYKEIWAEVEPYNMTWDETTVENDTMLIKKRLIKSCIQKEYKSIEDDIKKDSKIETDYIVDKEIIAKLDEKVLNILAEQKQDGSFDIDYFSISKSYWKPIDHLKKVITMQVALRSENSVYFDDDKVKNAVALAMQYWIANDFTCEWNNWYNNIGIGMYIPDILLLGIDGLSEDNYNWLVSKISTTLLQNSKLRFKLYERSVNESGGNLTDQVLSTLKVAVLENDYNTMMWLKSLLENELRPFPEYKGKNYHRWDAEGPKEDYSFQQHDQLIYFGGYGEVFLDGLNKYLDYTRNTQFELNEKALDFYADFIVEGIQFSTRNGYRDISASGRGIARENGTKGIWNNVSCSVNELLEYASRDKLSQSKAQKLEKLKANRFMSENDNGAGGHRYFYESDYNVYNDVNYMATVRHASKNTRIFEYLNGENPLGYYTGFGSTFYYIDGNEYEDVFPVYDWNKIPGTTTVQGKVPTMNQDMSYSTYGNTKKVAGVSNGKIGMSYFNQSAKNVFAKKAYFMFEDGVVCLGTGVNCLLAKDVVTNINQCNLDGEVYISQNGIESMSSSNFSGNVDYVYHDKISYIPQNNISLKLEYSKNGDWKTIDERRGNKQIQKDLFTLDINHGKMCVNDNYQYTVLMNTDLQTTKNYIANPTLLVVSNNKKVQGVFDKNNNVLQCVFYKPGEINVNGINIKVDNPCVCIVELQDTVKATVASCDGKELKLKMTIGNKQNVFDIKKSSTQQIFN